MWPIVVVFKENYIYIYIYIYMRSISFCICIDLISTFLHSFWDFAKCLHPVFILNLMGLFTNPSAWTGYDTRSIFKRSLTDLNSKFSFKTICLTKAEEISLPPYYLPIFGGRILGFIPFPRVLVVCEMQSVSSRIWTHGAVSIS